MIAAPDPVPGPTADAPGEERPDRLANAHIQALARRGQWDEIEEVLATWPHERASSWMSIGSDKGFAWAREALGSPLWAPMSDLVVFTHLPFCGGTSVASALSASFGVEGFEIPRRHGLPAIERFLTASRAERAAMRYLHHHHPYPLCHPGRQVRRVVVLRDPAGQMLSGYRKRMESPKIVKTRRMKTSTTFEEAVDHHERNGLVDLQVRELAAHHEAMAPRYERRYGSPRPRRALPLTGLWGRWRRSPGRAAFASISHEEDLFCWKATRGVPGPELLEMAREVVADCGDAVILTEHFALGYQVALASLGAQAAPRPPHRGRSKAPRTEVDPALMDRIRAMSPLDVTLHREVKERFETRWATALQGGHGS
jgi:hypothetical protein